MGINKRLLISTLIWIGIVNILIFVIPINRTSIVYLADVFIIIGAILMVLSFALAFRNSKDRNIARSRFYGWPIMRVGVLGCVCFTIVNICFIIITQFYPLIPWMIIVVNAVILAAVSMGLIETDSSRNFVENQRSKREFQKNSMKEIRLLSNELVDLCQNTELRKRMKVLADTFRYSDPNSDNNILEIDILIKSELELLRPMLEANVDDAFHQINKIEKLLKKRNQMVLTFK